MSENTSTPNDSASGVPADSVEDNGTAVPSDYDRQQDATSAEKDAEIAQLRSQLDALQQAAPDQVSSVPPVLGGSPSGASGPGDVPESAVFHEVSPAGTDSDYATGGDTVGSLPLGETPTVSVDNAPELSDSQNVTPDTSVQNQEELKAAVAEVLTLVREIHETVAWVKSEAPKIGAALAESPFGKMLPTFLNRM